MLWLRYLAIAVAFALLLLTSGPVISGILKRVIKKNLQEAAADDKPPAPEVDERLAVGNIIGKCENILILIFVILEAYTAIAIVITEKPWYERKKLKRTACTFLPAP